MRPPALMESPHLTLGQQAKVAAGIELVEQGKAELMTICRFIAPANRFRPAEKD